VEFVIKKGTCRGIYNERFSNKVVSQSLLAKNMYSRRTNIMDFYKEICDVEKPFEEIKLVTERVLVIPVHSVTRYIQGHL
jgi:hypothetical protein